MAGMFPMIKLNRDEFLFNKEWASEIHENPGAYQFSSSTPINALLNIGSIPEYQASP
jgi:hypothetical protein